MTLDEMVIGNEYIVTESFDETGYFMEGDYVVYLGHDRHKYGFFKSAMNYCEKTLNYEDVGEIRDGL